MNATTRLPTAVSIASLACCRRKFHVAISHQELKILHTSELSSKQLLLKSFRKCTSIAKGLSFTSMNLLESTSSGCEQVLREPDKIIMEPFLDTCYTNQPSPSANCEVPFSITTPTPGIVHHDDVLTNDIDVNSNAESTVSLESKCILDEQRYKAMRRWKKIGRDARQAIDPSDGFILRLLSFNILAQNLLETYPYLYREHDKRALPWETRKKLLLREILNSQANVICLQEMQEEHLSEFLTPFKESGYDYLYKKRTHDKQDGLLFLYRSDQFNLVDYSKVELYQSDIELLSRDNVGIIAKLSLKDSPKTEFVIATTHLLYNPRRNDVRLGQTQLLLAEIERIAFIGQTLTEARYLPIILCGDFNLEPFTGVYRFITEGHFDYRGKGRNLEPSDYRPLSNMLIPPRLCVTDNCQHFNVLAKRLSGKGNGRVMLENTENQCPAPRISEVLNAEKKECNVTPDTVMKETPVGSCEDRVNLTMNESQKVEIVEGHRVKFASGTLTHPFNLRSLYKHVDKYGNREATTNQGEWITVDYIFFSDVEPIEKYTLPTVNECLTLPTIPNFAVGSDHLCLGASFKIQKKNR